MSDAYVTQQWAAWPAEVTAVPEQADWLGVSQQCLREYVRDIARAYSLPTAVGVFYLALRDGLLRVGWAPVGAPAGAFPLPACPMGALPA